MADRRAGRIPHVRGTGGGKTPRSRNTNGQWRAKRSDTGGSHMDGPKGGWLVGAVVAAALVAIFKGLNP
jgi:hypothetical protein